MQHVAAGKDAGSAGLAGSVHHRAGGHAIHLHARAERQLVFGNQADGEQQRIAGHEARGFHLRDARSGINLRDSHALDALLAVDIDHGSVEIQRNVVILQALDDVSV